MSTAFSLRLAVGVDVQLVAERAGQLLDVQQRLAAPRLPLEHVLEQVVVELHRLLAGGVVEGDVVQGVLVAIPGG